MNHLYDLKVEDRQYSLQTYRDILERLSEGEVPFTSQLRTAGSGHWKSMLQFKDFSHFLVGKLMLASTGYTHESLFNHWYVKEGDLSFGPFSFLQMLEFHQQKRVSMDTLVGHSSFSVWQPFSLCEPFRVDSLKQLVGCEEINKIICRRKSPRINYSNETFLSSRAELYRGVTWSLSRQGLGILTDEPTRMEVNHRVNIIVNSNNEHGTVQVKGHVVNIRKESNYERVAIVFDEPHQYFNEYIQKRVPDTNCNSKT